MEKEWILLSEYVKNSRVELDFILRLEEEGLIETTVQENEKFLPVTQLSELESYARLYYDLSINVEGIDVIHNLLGKISEMERELTVMKRQFETDPFFKDFFSEE